MLSFSKLAVNNSTIKNQKETELTYFLLSRLNSLGGCFSFINKKSGSSRLFMNGGFVTSSTIRTYSPEIIISCCIGHLDPLHEEILILRSKMRNF